MDDAVTSSGRLSGTTIDALGNGPWGRFKPRGPLRFALKSLHMNLTCVTALRIIRNMSNYRNDETERLATMFKALSNPHRLNIFVRLAMCCQDGTRWEEDVFGCSCIGEVAQNLGISPSTVSHHVKELRQSGLIRTERVGQQIRCWIEPETLRYLADFFSRYHCCCDASGSCGEDSCALGQNGL